MKFGPEYFAYDTSSIKCISNNFNNTFLTTEKWKHYHYVLLLSFLIFYNNAE